MTGATRPAARLLLDTHIVIWMATTPDRIPKRMIEAIESAEQRFVSHVTALEIQLKNLKNAKLFPFNVDHLEAATKAFSCTGLPISYNEIRAIAKLKGAHSDPFDRLLMAQAMNNNLILATLDGDILRYARKSGQFAVLSRSTI